MPGEELLHVLERVDGDALAPDLAERLRVVGVVAHQGRHVEGRREPGLAVLEQVAEARVRLLGRAEAGELPHRPEPPAVHRGVDAARVREGARVAEVAVVVDLDVRRACRAARSSSPDIVAEERVALRALPRRASRRHSSVASARLRSSVVAMRTHSTRPPCRPLRTPRPRRLSLEPGPLQGSPKRSLERGKFGQFSPFSYRIEAAPPPGRTISCPGIARV